MFIMKWKDNKKGILVIEVLIVVAIITIGLSNLLGLTEFSIRGSNLAKETAKALNLTKEAIEATRSIRDGDWDKMIGGNHGLTNADGYWDFEGTENIIDEFTRTILIENVQRDTNDNIVESGGTNDLDTKKITVIISWYEKGKIRQIEIPTYLTNWKQ